MKARWLVAVAWAAALPAVPLAAGADETFPGKRGKLLFQSKRDGNYELYTKSAAGAARKLLSRPQTDEFNAHWSPSGDEIVFQTGPPDRSTYDVWKVGADGRGAKQLVGGATNDYAPQFCTKKTVVFTRAVSPTNSEIYAVGTDGKGLRRLTDNAASDSFPTCNAKGTRIAFISGREGPPRIYEMNVNGSNQRAIVAAPSLDPDYSPNGKFLAYVAPDADRNLEVFVKDLATGDIVQLTNAKTPLEYRLPKHTPDGKIVATERDTQTSDEGVKEVTGAGAQTLVENASGGTVQPLGRCFCYQLTLRVVDANREVGVRGGREAAIVRLDVRWTLSCGPGIGGCKAALIALRGAGDIPGYGPLSFDPDDPRSAQCRGPCGRSTTGVDRFVGTGNVHEFASNFTLHSDCSERDRLKDFRLAFRKTGALDRGRSDLDGDGRLDGSEKKP